MTLLNAVIGVFVWLLGLCIGSFLNVVIYRLPLGLSLSQPRWSFCPHCKATIHWYDNIPVLSWLLLRAKCRNCRAPISAQYPLVEAATGLAFALVYALLVFENSRAGLIAMSLSTDTPLLLAWLVLTAALVACAGMDIFAYVIDVRVTNLALAAAVLLYFFWDSPAFTAPTAVSPLTAGFLAAFLVGFVRLWISERHPPPEDLVPPEPDQPDSAAARPAKPGNPGSFAFAAAIVMLLSLVVVLCAAPASAGVRTFLIPGGFAVLLALLSLAGGEPRAADEELHEALESESPQARRVAWREILWLSPAIIAGVLVFFAVRNLPVAQSFWEQLARSHFAIGGLTLSAAGVLFSVHGLMTGIIVGWIVRILFTLVFGREAFGVGDIYILAAAGAAAGWDIVLLAFPLSVAVALIIFLVSLLRKRTPLVAFGPPLGLGFLLALWLSRPATVLAQKRLDEIRGAWSARPDIVLVGIGLLLVGAAVSVIFARLVRRLIER